MEQHFESIVGVKSEYWQCTETFGGFALYLPTQTRQERPTNCGTKAADVLENLLAGKL